MAALFAMAFAGEPTPGAQVPPSTSTAAAQHGPAQQAALDWLALVDAGDYGASYDTAAALFRAAVTHDGWTQVVGATRTQVGAMKSRTLWTSTTTTTLPNAPAGDYVVIVYKSAFANLPTATETVTPMKDPDGTWRVSGYYIH